MSKNIFILVASMLTLTGCSDQQIGDFFLGIILFFGVPYFFIRFTNKIIKNSPSSFIAKIFQDSNGEARLLPIWLLAIAWLFCIEKIVG